MAIAKRLGRPALSVGALRLLCCASLRRALLLVAGIARTAVQLSVAAELRRNALQRAPATKQVALAFALCLVSDCGAFGVNVSKVDGQNAGDFVGAQVVRHRGTAQRSRNCGMNMNGRNYQMFSMFTGPHEHAVAFRCQIGKLSHMRSPSEHVSGLRAVCDRDVGAEIKIIDSNMQMTA